MGLSRRYLCESFLRCLSPYPGGVLSAFAWFFLSIPRPSPPYEWVDFPLHSTNTIFRGPIYEAAAISLCSGLPLCSPPRSFLPQQVSLQGSRGFLHPSRTCVVTFARIGHAIRPTTGNWRNEDSHLARFAALSAAHVWLRLYISSIANSLSCAWRLTLGSLRDGLRYLSNFYCLPPAEPGGLPLLLVDLLRRRGPTNTGLRG